MNFKNKIIWITGASSGIGKSLATEFSKLGSCIILSSRNKEKLVELASQLIKEYKNEIDVIPLDISDSQSINEAYKIVKSKHKKIDILINNAGVSQRSLIIETPIEVDRKVFEINYFGTIALTKLILPWIIDTGGGHIVVISSIVGKFGFPLRSAYSASKHALHGFFETLRSELIDKNVKVTIVCPGRVVTNISVNAITKDSSRYGKMDVGQAKGISSVKCARKIIRSVKKNKKEVLIGGKEVFMVYMRKYFPGIFYKLSSRVKPT